MKPTIGRKVWLWVNSGTAVAVRDANQAVDATVIFVGEEDKIDVDYTDHAGQRGVLKDLVLTEPAGSEAHDPSGSTAPYCTWMPYQVGQAKAQEEKEAAKAAADTKAKK